MFSGGGVTRRRRTQGLMNHLTSVYALLSYIALYPERSKEAREAYLKNTRETVYGAVLEPIYLSHGKPNNAAHGADHP